MDKPKARTLHNQRARKFLRHPYGKSEAVLVASRDLVLSDIHETVIALHGELAMMRAELKEYMQGSAAKD